MLVLKRLHLKTFEHCDFVDLKSCSWRSPSQTQNNLNDLQTKIVRFNPKRNRNISVPTVCDPLNVFSQLSHQKFVHVSIVRIKVTTRKGITEGLPTNLPDLEETCTICLLKKATKIPRGKTIYVLKYPPGFMLQMDFSFFNVESIPGFTSTFVDICSVNSYPFGFIQKQTYVF